MGRAREAVLVMLHARMMDEHGEHCGVVGRDEPDGMVPVDGGDLSCLQLRCVVIVDPLPLFRDGLARLAESLSPGVCVEQSGSIGEMWECAAKAVVPDLFLIDLDLPELDTRFTLPKLRRTYRDATIMAMSLDEDEATIVSAMRSGCDGFIHKALPVEQCGRVISRVLDGTIVVERSPASAAATPDRTADHAIALTPRQIAVLSLLSQGASNKVIARDLGISHLTVRLHVSNLLRIFGVTRRAEVAPKARILGALSED